MNVIILTSKGICRDPGALMQTPPKAALPWSVQSMVDLPRGHVASNLLCTTSRTITKELEYASLCQRR